MTIKPNWPYFLANKPYEPNQDLEVTDKFTGEIATRVALADPATIEKGIEGCVEAAEPFANMRPYERQAILNHCVDRFTERFDELAMSLCIEAGKPIKDSRGEVSRLIDTFRIAAEESVRLNGEVMNLEISARAKGYQGIAKLVVDFGVNNDALNTNTALPRLIEGSDDDSIHSVFKISVVVDDASRIASQFQNDFLLSGFCLECPTDAGRTGKAEQFQAIIGCEQISSVARAWQN